MSKRSRATRSTRRSRPQGPAPAQRAATPTQRASTPAESPVAVAMAPVAPAPEPRSAPTRPQARANGKPSGLLAQRAANEYVYVAQDLRRIGTFAGAVAVIMALVWLLIDFAHVIAL
jgi:hypothetical protein